MKILPVAVFCLFAGLVIGSWQGRMRVRGVQQALDQAERLLQEIQRSASGFDAIASVLGVDGRRAPARERDYPVDDITEREESDTEPAPRRGMRRSAPDVPPGGETIPEQPDLRRSIEQAADIWTLRSTLARGSFVERAALTRQEIEVFDVLVDEMNVRISESVSAWSKEIRDAGSMQAGDGMRLVHDLTGILVSTYDDMDNTLDSGWREFVGMEFDLIDLVDPRAAEPLIDIEQELTIGADERRGRRDW